MSPILQSYRSSFRQPFIGEIFEYARKINLQGNYAIKGTFDDTQGRGVARSRYLIDVFKALKNPRIRVEVDYKGVQTAGSLSSDLTLPYRVEHDPGGMLLLMQDDDFAKKYCDTRLMPMLKSIPEIDKMIEGLPRYSKTKTEILFPGMTLIVGGLNEGNVQSLSWRYVTVDEGWRAKSNGLIRQAKARTTAFPYSSKFHLISQGGLEGDDLDIEWGLTNQQEWSWRCPTCSRLNIWEWTTRRDDKSYAGVLWDRNERTYINNKWNMGQVLLTIRVACKFCPGIWTDTPQERRRIDDNSEYLITNPGALPENSGHRWPGMANVDISLASLVQEYLEAKTQDDEFGYKLPLMEFYQKRLARPWSENTAIEIITLTSSPYDPNSVWPDEAYRFMVIDCQKDFTELHVLILAWSKDGRVRELYWGTHEYFSQCEERQNEFKVPVENVFVDLGYEQTKVAAECVKHGRLVTNAQNKTTWLCWKGLKGSDTERFPHKVQRYDGNGKVMRDPHTLQPLVVTEQRIYSEIGFINPNIGQGPKSRTCPYYSWSNLHGKDILKRYRDGQAGKVEWLPDPLPKNDPRSATAQMNSEFRKREVSEKGRKTNRWVQIGKRPNHRWDCWAMQIICACRAGIIGHAAPAEENNPPGS